jgi:hypothetical protein
MNVVEKIKKIDSTIDRETGYSRYLYVR